MIHVYKISEYTTPAAKNTDMKQLKSHGRKSFEKYVRWPCDLICS